MTKVAVCFAGQFRFGAETLASFQQHLFAHYDCDVFVHTWNYDDSLGKPYSPIDSTHGTIPDNYREIIASFNPKATAIDKPPYSLMQNSVDYPRHVEMQMFSKRSAYDLAVQYGLDHNVDYDCFLLGRANIKLLDTYRIDPTKLDQFTCFRCNEQEQKIADQLMHGNKAIMFTATHDIAQQVQTMGIWKEPGRPWRYEHYLYQTMRDIVKSPLETKFLQVSS